MEARRNFRRISGTPDARKRRVKHFSDILLKGAFLSIDGNIQHKRQMKIFLEKKRRKS